MSLEASSTSIEVLLVQIGDQWLGVRTKRLLRLAPFSLNRLSPIPEELSSLLPALLGVVSQADNMPVIDLVRLLELPLETRPSSEQMMIIEYEGLAVGFVVQVAQEIERVNLKDIRLLPRLVEQSLVKPVVWAIWQRSAEEPIPLIEPTEALSLSEWNFLMNINNLLLI